MTDIIKDIFKAFAIIKEQKPGYTKRVTVHNPKCKCIETDNLDDCNCGGKYFPNYE